MSSNVFSEPPNWVKARADCNIDLTFEALFGLVQRDAKQANGIDTLTEGRFKYSVQKEYGGAVPMFSVARQMNGSPVATVRFEMLPLELRVSRTRGRNRDDGFSVTPRWNESECKCDLFIGDEPHELWQVSQKALEPLFFRSESS